MAKLAKHLRSALQALAALTLLFALVSATQITSMTAAHADAGGAGGGCDLADYLSGGDCQPIDSLKKCLSGGKFVDVDADCGAWLTAIPAPAACGSGATFNFSDSQCWQAEGASPAGCVSGSKFVGTSSACLTWRANLAAQAIVDGQPACGAGNDSSTNDTTGLYVCTTKAAPPVNGGCPTGQVPNADSNCIPKPVTPAPAPTPPATHSCPPGQVWVDSNISSGCQLITGGDGQPVTPTTAADAICKDFVGAIPSGVSTAIGTQVNAQVSGMGCDLQSGTSIDHKKPAVVDACTSINFDYAGSAWDYFDITGNEEPPQDVDNYVVGQSPDASTGYFGENAAAAKSFRDATLTLQTKYKCKSPDPTINVQLNPATTDNIKKLTNGLEFYALLFCVAAIFLSGILWAAGSKGQNPGQELTGKRGLIVAVVAAFLIGATPPIMSTISNDSKGFDQGSILQSPIDPTSHLPSASGSSASAGCTAAQKQQGIQGC